MDKIKKLEKLEPVQIGTQAVMGVNENAGSIPDGMKQVMRQNSKALAEATNKSHDSNSRIPTGA
jgi:hypothetical protein